MAQARSSRAASRGLRLDGTRPQFLFVCGEWPCSTITDDARRCANFQICKCHRQHFACSAQVFWAKSLTSRLWGVAAEAYALPAWMRACAAAGLACRLCQLVFKQRSSPRMHLLTERLRVCGQIHPPSPTCLDPRGYLTSMPVSAGISLCSLRQVITVPPALHPVSDTCIIFHKMA